MMETKVPDFVSAMSRTIKCNHHSKLLVNQQGLFYTVKKQKKIVLYLQMFQHTKLYLSFSKISAPALFLKFQPRYSYKYIIKKKLCLCQAAHQASTDKNNVTIKQFTVFSWSVRNVRLQSFRYQHSSSCEAT